MDLNAQCAENFFQRMNLYACAHTLRKRKDGKIYANVAGKSKKSLENNVNEVGMSD